MTLEILLARSGISRWDESVWLKGAKLQGPLLLLTGDALTVAFVERNFLPKMREHISDLVIRQAPPARPSAEPRPGQTKYPALKAGAWRDLLDSRHRSS